MSGKSITIELHSIFFISCLTYLVTSLNIKLMKKKCKKFKLLKLWGKLLEVCRDSPREITIRVDPIKLKRKIKKIWYTF